MRSPRAQSTAQHAPSERDSLSPGNTDLEGRECVPEYGGRGDRNVPKISTPYGGDTWSRSCVWGAGGGFFFFFFLVWRTLQSEGYHHRRKKGILISLTTGQYAPTKPRETQEKGTRGGGKRDTPRRFDV